jgi:hypothetical protein
LTACRSGVDASGIAAAEDACGVGAFAQAPRATACASRALAVQARRNEDTMNAKLQRRTLITVIAIATIVAPTVAHGEQEQPAPATAQDSHVTPASTDPAIRARDRLARIELMIMVDRDFDGAARELDAMRAEEPVDGRTVFDDAGVAAEEQRLRGLIAAARSDSSQPLLDAVRGAIDDGDLDLIRNLGAPAVPVLLQFVESSADGAATDPKVAEQLLRALTFAIQMSPSAVLDFLDEHARRGQPLKPRRLLAALARSNVLHGSWSVVPGRQPVCTEPRWLDVLADAGDRLLKDDDGFDGWLNGQVSIVAGNEGLTPALNAMLIRRVLVLDRRRAIDLIDCLSRTDRRIDCAQAFLEAAMRHSDGQVRARAGEYLRSFPANSVLRAHVRDPDREVRLVVLRSLQGIVVRTSVWRDRSSPSTDEVQYGSASDDEARQLWATLADDPDPVVREATAKWIAEYGSDLDPDLHRRLAADADPGVRKQMTKLALSDKALQTEILVRLAGDPERIVLDELDYRLGNVDWSRDTSSGFVPVLLARIDNPTDPIPLDADGVPRGSDVFRRAANGKFGIVELTKWALQRRAPRTLLWLAQRNEPSSDMRSSSTALASWSTMEPDLVLQLVGLIDPVDPVLAGATMRDVASQPSGSAMAESMSAMRDDPKLSVPTRMLAAVIPVRNLAGESEARLLRFLADDAVRAWVPQDHDADIPTLLGRAIPASDRNRIILRVLQENLLSDAAARSLSNAFEPVDPDADALSLYVLQRWLPGTGPYLGALEKALRRLPDVREPFDHEVLLTASRDERYVDRAARSMAKIRDPIFIPRLGELLTEVWQLSEDQVPARRQSVFNSVVNGLVGYMSEDAVGALLEGAARLQSAEPRDQVLKAVESIHTYLDALSAWQRRTMVSSTREAAVGQLAALLTDENAEVRAAALRSLATLKAAEVLPSIVTALKDPVAEVRTAASEALTRINAPEPAAAARPAEPAQTSEDKPDH